MCGWHQPKCLIGPDDTVHSLEEIAGRSALVFCGLGRPEAFVAGLTDLGVNVVDLVCYPDHYHYKQADVDMLAQRAELIAARFMLTTAKDWVKLRELDLPSAVPMLSPLAAARLRAPSTNIKTETEIANAPTIMPTIA